MATDTRIPSDIDLAQYADDALIVRQALLEALFGVEEVHRWPNDEYAVERVRGKIVPAIEKATILARDLQHMAGKEVTL